jgi:hypothetical protein
MPGEEPLFSAAGAFRPQILFVGCSWRRFLGSTKYLSAIVRLRLDYGEIGGMIRGASSQPLRPDMSATVIIVLAILLPLSAIALH